MTQEKWTAVDDYVTDLFHQTDPQLDAVLDASREAGLPAIHVLPNLGKLLMLLAQSLRARAILEIGTLGGYSTIWLARGMAEGGKLITLESDPVHAKVARSNIARARLNEKVDLRLGPAQVTLPQLAVDGAGPFDLIFIDADKEGYPDYLQWSLKLSRPGSLIIADNVVRGGEVVNPASEDPRVQGVRRFNQLLAADPRVNATILQTVGSKGWDGFAIAVVK
jgi:predicted O-methyltransferase YrrM